MEAKKKTILRFLAKSCYLLVAIWLLVFFTPLANFLAKPLEIKPDPQKADVILVLSGGVYANGSLSYFSLERLAQAVILYKKGLSPKIIFSGGVSLGNLKLSDGLAMEKVAIDLGVNKDDIIIENQSRNTYENLAYSKKIIEEKGYQRVLLVSSAIHMYRSMRIAEGLGLKVIPASPVPFEEYRQTPIDRFLLFYFTLREYAAILVYQLGVD